MKALHLTTYKIYRKTAVQPLRVVIFSDLHFSYLVSRERMTAILDLFKVINPQYILCPGDLVDYLDLVDDNDRYIDAAPVTCSEERMRLLAWLTEVAQIAPLLISLGNHDVYRRMPPERRRENGRQWLIERYSEFFERVGRIPGVKVLDNNTFSDAEIMVLGLTLSTKYYRDDTRKTGKKPFSEAIHEDKKELIQTLDGLNPKYLYNLSKNQLKFALIHSPVYLNSPEVARRLVEYDYLVAGHMHNGVVPPGLDELWRSNRGILAPTRGLWPAAARRTLKDNEDRLVTVGAVTTIHQCSGVLHYLNAVFPSYLTLLEFTSDEVYRRRPYVRRRYLGYGEGVE